MIQNEISASSQFNAIKHFLWQIYFTNKQFTNKSGYNDKVICNLYGRM